VKGLSDDFKASVAVSRQWDGKRVGQELVDKIRDDDVDPDFILLFSTIHYEGEFQKFLDILKDEFPDAPLVGGTVAGFMCQEGCYTRGVSAMVVEYENMDVAVGVGHNTKRNPERAAEKCFETIKGKLSESEFENKFTFSFISSSLGLDLPFLGNRKVIKSRFLGKIFIKLFPIISWVFQKGIGKERELMERAKEITPNYKAIFGSCMDRMDFLRNYQFFQGEVYENSVVSLGLSSSIKFDVGSFTGMEETKRKLKVTEKSYQSRIIKEFNGEPAAEEYLNAMGCAKDYLTEEKIYDVAPYFPIGYIKNDKLRAAVVGYLLGENIMTSYKNEKDELSILSVSGEKLLNAINESFHQDKNKKKVLSLSVSCATILYTLGKGVYEAKNIIEREMNGEPFLVLYMAGEGSLTPKKFYIGNETHTQGLFIK